MIDYPLFNTHKIQCGNEECDWQGFEGQLVFRENDCQSRCPKCGCETYSFIEETK